MLEINIERYLKATHIFSSAVWHLPREIFDLAIKSLNKVRRLKIHRGWLQKRKHLNEKLISKILLKVMGTISYFSGCPWYLEWTMSTLYPSPHQGCPTWSFTRLYFYVATIFLHDLLLVLLSSYWNTKSRTSLSLSKIEAKIRISHGFRRSNEICMHKTNHGTW